MITKNNKPTSYGGLRLKLEGTEILKSGMYDFCHSLATRKHESSALN